MAGNSFNLATVFENTILTISKNTKILKAGALDNLSGSFLKNRTKVLAKPNIDLSFNLLLKIS